MDTLEIPVDKIKKIRKQKQPTIPEEITSVMMSQQFDKIFVELKKLESYIFKPIVEPVELVVEPIVPPLKVPPVKKSRAKKLLTADLSVI